VDLSDSWSRAQVRAIWASIPDRVNDSRASLRGVNEENSNAEDAFLACLRPKVLSVHLTCVDAEAITSASDLTPARTLQMDTRLYTWFSTVWVRHLSALADLGNALGRKLFVTSGIPVAMTEPALESQNHS
jgi:hypothetical protein